MFSIKKEIWLKRSCYVVFIVYILVLMKIVLFKYTGIQNLFEKIVNGNLEGFRSFNVIPFRTFQQFGKMMVNGEFSRGFINLAGNMLIFVPFGYFLPLLFEKCREIKMIILLGFVVSSLFELCQYVFYLGSTDIDDIILNVLGVILGIACYQWMQKLTKERKGLQYAITLMLSTIGFMVAFFIAVNYFGLMFGINSGAEYSGKYVANMEKELGNVQIETNAEREFDMLGDIVSVEEDVLTINQVMELDENRALSSNDNRNLKTINLLPSTQYSQMDIYDSEGKKVETKKSEKENLQAGKRIDIKGYMDGTEFFATEIVISNYLF